MTKQEYNTKTAIQVLENYDIITAYSGGTTGREPIKVNIYDLNKLEYMHKDIQNEAQKKREQKEYFESIAKGNITDPIYNLYYDKLYASK